MWMNIHLLYSLAGCVQRSLTGTTHIYGRSTEPDISGQENKDGSEDNTFYYSASHFIFRASGHGVSGNLAAYAKKVYFFC